MKLVIDKKIGIGYLLAFVFFLISFFLFFSTTNKMIQHNGWSNTAKAKILNLEVLFSTIKIAGENYQNYLLNGNNQFLKNFNETKAKTIFALQLVISPVNDSLQKNDNNKLEVLVNNLIKNYDQGLAQFNISKKGFSDTIKTISQEAGLNATLLQSQIIAMQNGCHKLSTNSAKTACDCFNNLKVIYFTTLSIAFLIGLYSLLAYIKENKARQNAEDAALINRTQLEEKIEQLNLSNKQLNDLKSIEKFAATGRMARMIAHEVRNPLTNIGLANDQLKDAVEANEENMMLISMIKRNGERINNLVGDLLNATKFVELNLSEHAINDLLDQVVLMAKDKIDSSNTKITKSYSSKMFNVLVDADKIKIALLNILLNSIEAIKSGDGKIEIITSDSDKMCVVTIKDNGAGMSKEVLAKLFEPFFTSKDKGNGLGLTNTQNIILNHKGNILVESEVGKGTDFTVKLNFA